MDLSSADVETDGLDTSGMLKLLSSICTASTSIQEKKDNINIKPRCKYASTSDDNRQDSGVASIDTCPRQFTHSDDSGVESLLSDKLERAHLSNDEGIFSISAEPSWDQEDVDSKIASVIEVDLNETDKDGDTILHTSILLEKNVLAIALIDLADDVKCLNIQNLLRQTPLHLAVLLGQTSVVQSLIDHKVDVTLQDHQGNTPLHIACRRDDQDAVRIIVESFRNNIEARRKYFAIRNCEGLTCLHVASQSKAYMIMGHLFMKGADVNIRDAKSGRTMLHYAVERRDLETVKKLLTHSDIDINCKTYKGETPLVIAYWRNYRDILRKLKSKGAYFSYDLVEESDDEWS